MSFNGKKKNPATSQMMMTGYQRQTQKGEAANDRQSQRDRDVDDDDYFRT